VDLVSGGAGPTEIKIISVCAKRKRKRKKELTGPTPCIRIERPYLCTYSSCILGEDEGLLSRLVKDGSSTKKVNSRTRELVVVDCLEAFRWAVLRHSEEDDKRKTCE